MSDELRIVIGAVAVVVLFLGGLLWFVRRHRRPAEAGPPTRPSLKFVEAPARGIFRMAGLWHCTHCGQTLDDGESHLIVGGDWTCRRGGHPPVSFKTPAAKGFGRGGRVALAYGADLQRSTVAAASGIRAAAVDRGRDRLSAHYPGRARRETCREESAAREVVNTLSELRRGRTR